ncbi:DUF3658 domain-containing protein [Proteiniclasticum sp. QWL-01]|uniref:DUF3658 domain-containing protein n=1 Tax=Proteiniclasticum sp. QWL-01 TaxID=3036945 RepID=UPI0024101651|nr:DUF3658 domain-containing protein [Proteiniclasticum sp. QWL-01]WFF71882.1 DUF3658 domain-containing protein [Proteiniclasticum sp. QWL-01]
MKGGFSIIVSDYWHDLMEENAPLRAIINGKITSVPEDFYDFIIIRNLPENDFIMARFIGKLLGEYSLGISDSWYAATTGMLMMRCFIRLLLKCTMQWLKIENLS